MTVPLNRNLYLSLMRKWNLIDKFNNVFMFTRLHVRVFVGVGCTRVCLDDVIVLNVTYQIDYVLT